VETIRRDLHRELAGRVVAGVKVSGRRSIRRHDDPDGLHHRLAGRELLSVERRGKYLLLRCGPPKNAGGGQLLDAPVLVVHLGMSGQLLLARAGDPIMIHTHVVVSFPPEWELRFVDPRTFGEVFVSTAVGTVDSAGAPEAASNGVLWGEPLPELAHLGLDALDEVKDAAHLGDLLHARRAKLKPLLMDQRFLAGIGNMYADEILFAARLRYDRGSHTLTRREVPRLHQAMTETLGAAIRHRGSSLADQQYRDVFGAIGGFQLRHQVYGREGLPCPRCGKLIIRVKSAGRSNYLCPRCQR
jgi:formamidopyrimidine-DNA glycosylase